MDGYPYTQCTFIDTTAQHDPATFQCTKDSPVGGPVWSTNNPPVEMRHIFCGEIDRSFMAQGFHSQSPVTNWQTCAVTQQCQYFSDDNGYCRIVYIYDSREGSYEQKDSGSTLWPTSFAPAQLVPLFQYLYNTCPPVVQNAALCFTDCYWWGNVNYFDIVIGTEGAAIVTAYPAQRGTCTNHPQWQDCDNVYCQGIWP